VTVWVFEVEGLDAAGVGVPVRQTLGTGGSVLDLVLAQPLIGTVHVTNDNRDMLKPAIIAARVHWDRSALGRQIFGQLDELSAEPHTHDAHPQSEDSLQVFI